MHIKPLPERVEERIRAWNLTVESTSETPSSILVFGKRVGLPIVLKVSRQPGDEWHSGAVLAAFEGKGIVRAAEFEAGAVLLERLQPATSLAAIALQGRDDEATEILADVMQRMSPRNEGREAFVTVQEWGLGFARYLASDDPQIPRALVEQAQCAYTELCASQQNVRLLHVRANEIILHLKRDNGQNSILTVSIFRPAKKSGPKNSNPSKLAF